MWAVCSLQVYKKKSKSVCCGNTNNNYNDTTTVLSVCLLFLCITENVFWKLRGVGAAAPHGKEKKLKKKKQEFVLWIWNCSQRGVAYTRTDVGRRSCYRFSCPVCYFTYFFTTLHPLFRPGCFVVVVVVVIFILLAVIYFILLYYFEMIFHICHMKSLHCEAQELSHTHRHGYVICVCV